jgi:hypothetical protein
MGGDWLSWEARLVRIKAQIYLAAPNGAAIAGAEKERWRDRRDREMERKLAPVFPSLNPSVPAVPPSLFLS